MAMTEPQVGVLAPGMEVGPGDGLLDVHEARPLRADIIKRFLRNKLAIAGLERIADMLPPDWAARMATYEEAYEFCMKLDDMSLAEVHAALEPMRTLRARPRSFDC